MASGSSRVTTYRLDSDIEGALKERSIKIRMPASSSVAELDIPASSLHLGVGQVWRGRKMSRKERRAVARRPAATFYKSRPPGMFNLSKSRGKIQLLQRPFVTRFR